MVEIPKDLATTSPADIVPAEPTPAEKELGEEDAAYQGERTKLARAAGRLRARHAKVNVPAGLTGKEAEDWADKKAVELLPLAMAELEHNLLYGDDKARAEAAKDVRDMTGRGKRDGSGAGGPTIILVGAGDGQNPFLRRLDTPALKGNK